MTTSKYIDKICIGVLIIAVVVTVLFMNASAFGVEILPAAKGYEKLLFDSSKVHTINIIMDDWSDFISTCTDEKYRQCSVVIDQDAVKNVAIRAKGNTSLSNVRNYNNDRYSFKIEFDHYDKGKTYYGLDKLSLNNIIQDNTYMKDFLTYQMMQEFDVYAPLCSYVQVLVNGEEWGLYLAVEGVEASFLQRNFGKSYGNLYKPDNMDMGGGRGHGGDFRMEDWQEKQNMPDMPFDAPPDMPDMPFDAPPDMSFDAPPGMQGGPEMPEKEGGPGMPEMPGKEGWPVGGNWNQDISLIYSDDEFDSYQNIFDNVKTQITDADKKRLIQSLKALNEYSGGSKKSGIEETVNMDEVIRYFVVHNFVCNFDSYTGMMIHNYYLYEDDGQLSMIPWDYNLAFGGFENRSDATDIVNFPIDDPISGGTLDSRPMLNWIFESKEYTDLYHQYFGEFVSKYYDSGYFFEWIDKIREMIAPYVDSDPTKFCTYDEFEKGAGTLKDFCLLRFESVSCQLDGTISATAAGQEKDTLINAADIQISDMGSMEGAGADKGIGKGPGEGPERGLPPKGRF